MAASVHRVFLDYSISKLRQMSRRIEECLGQLSDDQVWARGAESENAVGNLVLHLCGNVRQWLVSGVGGEPDVRIRDEEFAARGGVPVSQLTDRLLATIADACAALDVVTAARLLERVTIQQYDVTVLEAIYHVVEHFSGHTGQIIFATKMLTGSDLGFHHHLRTTAAHGHKLP